MSQEARHSSAPSSACAVVHPSLCASPRKDGKSAVVTLKECATIEMLSPVM